MGDLSSIAVILGLGLFGTIREVHQIGIERDIDDYNIQRECTDPTNGAKYQIGEVWSPNEGCSQYECTQFNIRKLKKQQDAYINRTGIFAIAKLKGCIRPQDLSTHKQNPHYCEWIPEEIELKYPDCCSMYVCIRAHEIVVYRTNSTGDKTVQTHGMRKKPDPKHTLDQVTTKPPRRRLERNN